MFEKKLPASEKLALVEDIASMLKAGIPILEAVETTAEDATNKQAKKVLMTMAEDLKNGRNLATSFEKFPKDFDTITVNFMRAGEASGNLENVLKDLAKSIKAQIELTRKVKSGLMYPVFILLILFLMMGTMFFFVLPRISKVFKRLQMDLPLPTRILVAISDFAEANRPLIIISLLSLFTLFTLFFKIEKTRKIINRLAGKLPLIAPLLKHFDLARFCRSMSLLLSAGIPITEALPLAVSSVSLPKIASALSEAEETLLQGKGVAEGLDQSKKIFPAAMRRMVAVGEQTGGLEKSFAELAERYDKKTSDAIKNMTTMLEPILIVVIGLGIGGIILSIIAPIYNLIGQMRAR
jgi:type IV pilus assembly protein PilC